MRLILLVVALLGVSRAEAKPMHTKLDDLLKRSTTIVIATFEPVPDPWQATSYTLQVERALRGTAAKGPLVVKPSPDGHARFAAKTRVLVFLDAKRQWIGYGETHAGPSLEDGVVRLGGFYDDNAHMVTPGVVTLSELEGLITKGTPMKWVFKGRLLLPAKGGLVRSTFELVADVTAKTVTGIPKVAGFPAPAIDVGGWPGTDVRIEWNRSSKRPLELTGSALGKNSDGSIAVDFRLADPEALTEADFVRYVGDATLGHPYHELELTLGGKKLPVIIGRTSRLGTIGTDEITHTMLLAKHREIHTKMYVIELAPFSYKTKPDTATPSLAEEVIALTPIKCTHTVHSGPSTPCTLRYVGTRFATP